MNKKEKLQAKIAKYQAELHTIQAKEWWEARPHIAEFECGYDNEYDDNGSYSKYFHAYGILLNHEWIKYNNIKWQTFCDHLGIPLYPVDSDEIAEYWEEYLRDINNPDDYDVDYPDFVQHAEETMVNPNFSSTVSGV
jgi:hypothetical protein